MRNIENMKIQDKITDILDHGHKGVIDEKALEKVYIKRNLVGSTHHMLKLKFVI